MCSLVKLNTNTKSYNETPILWNGYFDTATWGPGQAHSYSSLYKVFIDIYHLTTYFMLLNQTTLKISFEQPQKISRNVRYKLIKIYLFKIVDFRFLNVCLWHLYNSPFSNSSHFIIEITKTRRENSNKCLKSAIK